MRTEKAIFLACIVASQVILLVFQIQRHRQTQAAIAAIDEARENATLYRCRALLGGWEPTHEFARAMQCKWTITTDSHGDACFCLPLEKR